MSINNNLIKARNTIRDIKGDDHVVVIDNLENKTLESTTGTFNDIVLKNVEKIDVDFTSNSWEQVGSSSYRSSWDYIGVALLTITIEQYKTSI